MHMVLNRFTSVHVWNEGAMQVYSEIQGACRGMAATPGCLACLTGCLQDSIR